jgi:hypothetical protein
MIPLKTSSPFKTPLRRFKLKADGCPEIVWEGLINFSNKFLKKV